MIYGFDTSLVNRVGSLFRGPLRSPSGLGVGPMEMSAREARLFFMSHPLPRSNGRTKGHRVTPSSASALNASRLALLHLRRELARIHREFQQLSQVGMALMAEHNQTALLHLIVEQGKQLTDSDGAGLLFLEARDNRAPYLVPVAYHFDSLPNLGLPYIRYAVDGSSIVGYAALTRAPVVVDDIHQLPRGTRFTGSAEFQRRYRY